VSGGRWGKRVEEVEEVEERSASALICVKLCEPLREKGFQIVNQ
jgi:hypothetical protein